MVLHRLSCLLLDPDVVEELAVRVVVLRALVIASIKVVLPVGKHLLDLIELELYVNSTF